MVSLPYKMACITGASRGIGRAFAVRLAEHKLDLLLCARNQEQLDALAAELREAFGLRVEVVAADLATREGRDELVARASSEPIDLLLNNAGVGLGGLFVEHGVDALQSMLELNVVGLSDISRRLLPTLLQRDSALVHIASQAGFFPMPKMSAYAASKAYVLHLSEAMAQELRHSRVHVMALCPGATATDFFQTADIALSKTRLSTVPAAQVVDEGLAALRRRRRVHVVSFAGRLQTGLIRFAPRTLITRVAEAIMER